MKFEIASIEELDQVADHIRELMKERHLFLLNGPMGSGKTTLMKSLVRLLESEKEASSPSYALVNEYAVKGDKKVYHFDLYRINKIEELLDIGIEEYIYSEDYCFIEWPDLAESIYPENRVIVNIQPKGSKRLIEVVSNPN